jgi:hypothetical protein
MSLIQFSVQYGGGNSRGVINPHHQMLNKIFYKDENKTGYFKTLEFFSIILRVSGSIRDFKAEGAENLKKVKGKNIYTIDLLIPQNQWDGVDEMKFKKHLVRGIKSCLNQLIDKCEEEIINQDKLRSDIDSGITDFLSSKSR